VDRIEWHKRRLAHMPWLYARLKPADRAWAHAWQAEVQAELRSLECVELGEGCFIAPDAHIFGEPGRPVRIGDGAFVGAGAFLHGPITIGSGVGVNPGVHISGGARGVVIGDLTRVASGTRIYAWNHGTDPGQPIRDQRAISRGITIGRDVWIGANVGIPDDVCIGDHAVVAMGAVVTRAVDPWAMVAGVPARVIGDRRVDGRGPGRRRRTPAATDRE
jgi:acetyltransferase-like isoleucine patch superfamily enzyme